MQGGLPQLEELFHGQASLTNDRGQGLWCQVPSLWRGCCQAHRYPARQEALLWDGFPILLQRL